MMPGRFYQPLLLSLLSPMNPCPSSALTIAWTFRPPNPKRNHSPISSNLFTNKWQFDTAFPSLKTAEAPGLLQNFDLPPPLKRFSPEQSSLGVNGYSNKQSLLMAALQRSQSRAREAERKEKLAIIRSGKLAAMLLEESMRLLVVRRWAMLLELEIAVLRREERRGLGDEAAATAAEEEEEEEEEG